MINQLVISGNLVDKVRESVNQQGKLTVFGKLAVYNGKRPDGTQRDAMFFDIVVFNKDAEIIRDNTDKGCPIVVIGRLEEDTTISQTNGQTYVNKKIVCTSARPLLKPVMTQNVATQAAQNMDPYNAAQVTQNMDPFM